MKRADIDSDEFPESFHLQSCKILCFHFVTWSLKSSDESPVIGICAELVSCPDSEVPRGSRVQLFVVQLESDYFDRLTEF